MTWKTGDTVQLPIYLSADGTPTVYANAAAFVSAGGTTVWYSGATALASQPAYTLTPIAGKDGWHSLSFILPSGVDHVIIVPVSTVRSDPADYLLVVPNDDTDSLASLVSSAVGTTLPGSSVQALDFTIIEGDNFEPQEFTIPATALSFIDTGSNTIVSYADLADIGGNPWTIAAQARGAWNELPASAVDFSFSAIVTSKTNRTVAIGFYNAVPAGAVVKNPDGTTDTDGTQTSTDYKYDIQLQPPTGSTYAGRKLTVVVGTVTIIRQQTTTP